MQMLTENTIYLWLLPMTIFIIIPLLMLATWMVLTPIKRVFKSKEPIIEGAGETSPGN